MGYKRDPNLPPIVRDSNHPATKLSGRGFAYFMLPLLVAIAWWKAPQFDPYTMSFFTRSHVEPSPDMPGELRLVGWVLIGIGVLLGVVCANGVARARVTFHETWIVLWIGICIAAFGGAFFAAADSAQLRIEKDLRDETGQA